MNNEFLRRLGRVVRGEGEQERFFQVVQEHEEYMGWSANEGPHSFHGKFYRRVAAEKEGEAGRIVDSVMRRSGEFEYGFVDLYERCRERFGIGFRPMDLITSILKGGMDHSGEDWGFDDVIVEGVKENIGPRDL